MHACAGVLGCKRSMRNLSGVVREEVRMRTHVLMCWSVQAWVLKGMQVHTHVLMYRCASADACKSASVHMC